MLSPPQIHDIHTPADYGDEETLAETGHHVGCQTPAEKYGSINSPSRVDRSSLVSIISLTKASTDRNIRCVGSCTAHLEELTDATDLVQGVGMEVAPWEGCTTKSFFHICRFQLQAI